MKQYHDRLIIEEERTRKHVLSRGNHLRSGVVGTASPRCWAPLLASMLIHPNCCEVRSSALLGLTAVFGEVTDLPAFVARVTSRRELLWWWCCCCAGGGQLYCCCYGRLPQICSKDLRGCPAGGVQIMRYFRRSTARTASGGSWHGRFLFFSSATSQAFMVPSWSMAALASSLYGKF
jgi:hypothetical protein